MGGPVPTPFGQPCADHADAPSNFGSRMRSLAVIVRVNLNLECAAPRGMGRASRQSSSPQPNGSSVRLRFCWLIA
jgi:hypothetical protein